MGFVLENKLLIIAGALDGSSGLILSIIMCRAMNRSFTNVLFGAFGQVQAARPAGEAKTAKSATPQDVAELLENGRRVVIVPGYGMAVAQAQHRVRELYDQLTKRGIDVQVRDPSGRRPHAGAHERAARRGGDSRTTRWSRWTTSTPSCRRPTSCSSSAPTTSSIRRRGTTRAARSTACRSSTPTRRRRVIAIKRSMNPGFAGIENELYYADNTLMVFGDAKQVLGDVVKALSGGRRRPLIRVPETERCQGAKGRTVPGATV